LRDRVSYRQAPAQVDGTSECVERSEGIEGAPADGWIELIDGGGRASTPTVEARPPAASIMRLTTC